MNDDHLQKPQTHHQFYGTRDVGKFPHRLKPDTHTPHIDVKKRLLNFKDTNLRLEELILAVYMPMSYIKAEYRAMYRERFQTRYNNKVIFSHEDREFITAKMHRFNLFKRLDSSVFAFGETIRRLKERIEKYIFLLEENLDKDLPEDTGEMTEEGDFLENDAPALDYKYTIKVNHLNKKPFSRIWFLTKPCWMIFTTRFRPYYRKTGTTNWPPWLTRYSRKLSRCLTTAATGRC